MPALSLNSVEMRDLLARFVRYVKIDTQSNEESSSHPSTEKQKNLGRLLVEELKALGADDAAMADTGHVVATLPSNLPNLPADPPGHGKVPVLGFLAHLDTYPGTSGKDVKPQVIESYAGGDITLPATGETIPVASNPKLADCLGHTLIHTDGNTLLGADDKAGIAEIMTMLDWLGHHPEFRHGKLRIAFTPDEEIGRGVEGFDVSGFAADYAYTVDGAGLGEVEDETFSADSATITITGHDVHPGYAKGVMVNAIRIAAQIVAALPVDHLPETTEGRQSYLHAHAQTGDVASAQIKLLVRAFSEQELEEREAALRNIVDQAKKQFPAATIDLAIKPSYRNMREHIAKDSKVLDHAILAIRRQGVEPVRRPVRGGTDGSRLSAMGLLTPNLFAGGESPHSVREWASLQWMAAATCVCLQLVGVWVDWGGATRPTGC
jgi:tripeptide aminopeptidase